MKNMLRIVSIVLLVSLTCGAQNPAPTPAAGPYYFMSGDINPNQFPWGTKDSFGGVTTIENLTLLATVLGDVPVVHSLLFNLLPLQPFDFGAGTVNLQPFAGTVPFVRDKISTLPIGSQLRAFLDEPLQGANFDLTLPFLDNDVGLSDSSALLRIQRNDDGSIKANNDAGVWHTAIDFDDNVDTSREFDVIAPANGIIEGNVTDGCAPTASLAIRHTASNGVEFLTLYGHLDPESKRNLPVGTFVVRGQKIGRIKKTEENYAHLHFGVAVRGPARIVNGTSVPRLWYVIDPFGVYDYRRNRQSPTNYNYLPNNTLDQEVREIRHKYVFRTNPVNGSFVTGPQEVTAFNQHISVSPIPTPVTLHGISQSNAPLAFGVISQPSHGTLSGAGTNLVYIPALNFTGSDSFSFRVIQFLPIRSAVATIFIDVRANNNAPAAPRRNLNAVTETEKRIELSGSDTDNDPLSVVAEDGPLHGRVVFNGSIACYVSNDNYLGDDSFTYRVSDGITTSAPATVTLHVKNGITITSTVGLEKTPLAFWVLLLAPSPDPVTVQYDTVDETARAGSDFVAATGVVTLQPNVMAAPIIINTLDDRLLEGVETFRVQLSNPSANALLTPSDAFGRGMILDDDVRR